MQVTVKPGTYVLGVSGGVDSMVLLDLLRQRPGVKLVVAHFDHGIRPDSHLDRQHVQQVAHGHGLPFVHHRGELGPKASEALAREARYNFLHQARVASGAHAIITAHHQDDVLETMLINLLRGTGRLGMTSLKSTDGIIRPLLSYPKDRLYDYAAAHSLSWREDETNQDARYLRNYIRHNILAKFTPGQRAQLLILLEQMHDINDQVDELLTSVLHIQPGISVLDRRWFIGLPHAVARETVHHWLRRAGVQNLSEKGIERLVQAMKTAQPRTFHDVDKAHILKVQRDKLALVSRDR